MRASPHTKHVVRCACRYGSGRCLLFQYARQSFGQTSILRTNRVSHIFRTVLMWDHVGISVPSGSSRCTSCHMSWAAMSVPLCTDSQSSTIKVISSGSSCALPIRGLSSRPASSSSSSRLRFRLFQMQPGRPKRSSSSGTTTSSTSSTATSGMDTIGST